MKVLAAIALAITANAAPAQQESHELNFVKRGDIEFPYFYPGDVTFVTNAPSESANLLPTSDEEEVAFGTEQLMKSLGVSADQLEVTRSYKTKDGVMHIYAVEKINGIQVLNHDAAIHVLNGEIIAQSASFNNNGDSLTGSIADNKPLISLEEAVKTATALYGLERDNFPASNAYLELAGNKIVYVHNFQLRNDAQEKWIQVSVDAQTGQVVHVIDYVNHATYKVVKLPKNIPLEGFEVATNPENSKASPNGWSTGTSTIGNNVDSRIGSQRVDGGASKNFDAQWDATLAPSAAANKVAAIVNNFYVSNMVHDITYQYGFDEQSGNFQEDNYGKGGQGSDSVTINNQASGSNNANFATPADGQNPTMNMFTWDKNTPNRDGSLENGVPIHEYGHGVSNRLTGGPSQSGCLSNTESGGMGEGWSDMLAMVLTQKPEFTRDSTYALGAYVYNNPNGIRQYKYSTDMKTNPFTYNTVSTFNQVHAIGSVWATILYEVYWNLVDSHGFAVDLMDATQKKGNVMFLQNMLGGMKIQPCSPKFISARDAIISADSTYYGGINKCAIWKGFAKRGLGTDAVQSGYKNGFKVPAECDGAIPQTTTTTTGPKPTTSVAVTTTTVAPVTTTGPIPTGTACAHDKCVQGVKLADSCDACVAKIIAADSYCGRARWDSTCVGAVKSVCGITC